MKDITQTPFIEAPPAQIPPRFPSARALEEGEDESSEEEDEVASLDEDEDELDEESSQYLELLQKKVQDVAPSSPFTISSQIIEVGCGYLQGAGRRAEQSLHYLLTDHRGGL